MGIQIEFSCEQLERVEKLLYGIPKAAQQVTARALNRGLEAAKTEASRQIRQRYAISTGNLNKYQSVKIQKASAGGEGYIQFAGQKIPLFRFQTSPSARTYVGEKIPVMVDPTNKIWRMVYKNAGVSAMDSRESGMTERPPAFIATFKSGHTGLFKRTGDYTDTGNSKIEEYWGYSAADMLDYEPAREAVMEKTQETVNNRLEHEIGRILSQY